MAPTNRIKMDLSFLSNSPLAKQVSQQWTGYETKLKDFVSELNLKSRDAREKSKKQLDKFATQLKGARTEVEKRVHDILDQEAKVLNKGFSELMVYLKSLATQEAASAAPTKKATKGALSSKKAKASTTKKTGKKTAKRPAKASASSKANGTSDSATVS